MAKVVQGFTVDITPINIQFSPDGKILMGWDSRNTTFSLHYNKKDSDLKGTWAKDPETKVAGETVCPFQNLVGGVILTVVATIIRALWIVHGCITEGVLLSRLAMAGFACSSTHP